MIWMFYEPTTSYLSHRLLATILEQEYQEVYSVNKMDLVMNADYELFI